VRVVPQAQCFHLVAEPRIVDEAIGAGAYLLTGSWLAEWPKHVQALGFEPQQAGAFFADFAKSLLLLDTGLDPQAAGRLAEFQATVGLPARSLAVGLDHTRLLLCRLVLTWRLEQAQQGAREQARQHGAELADYVAAMDLLTRLAKTQSEADTIGTIGELFQMLFAPGALYYLRLENNVRLPGSDIPPAMLEAMRALAGDHGWTPDGQGFLLRISHGAEVLGLIAVDRLAFPAYRQRYLNMALAVTGICGMAVANARNRRRLLEAEKMASLGILVAGVAHEINTPLGVSLMASSALKDQSRALSEHFAARTMTQSELTRYLDSAAAETALIQQNLERIGSLVATFRQVAVEGKPLQTHRFRLRATLEGVVRSLGERLDPRRVQLQIDCDPTLEIDGVPADWASIFINLITNSLQHGFRQSEQGVIGIRIARDARNRLCIDFRDDGSGIEAEALARIFDPFFTTDQQGGMGLGMHLVYNLVTHRMGGLIRCNSAAGEGAHFHIEVPQPAGGEAGGPAGR
jgi:signal transduction histidine kinase